MSNLHAHTPGLILGSLIFNTALVSEESLLKIWRERYGELFYLAPKFNPSLDYYSKEMGDRDLLRRIIVINQLPSDREELVEGKIWADQWEKETAYDGKRSVNVDIGQLTLENIQLATGKNYYHRVYLRQGVLADLTLVFKDDTFSALEWTYPDYAHPEKIQFFNHLRDYLILAKKWVEPNPNLPLK